MKTFPIVIHTGWWQVIIRNATRLARFRRRVQNGLEAITMEEFNRQTK